MSRRTVTSTEGHLFEIDGIDAPPDAPEGPAGVTSAWTPVTVSVGGRRNGRVSGDLAKMRPDELRALCVDLMRRVATLDRRLSELRRQAADARRAMEMMATALGSPSSDEG